MIRLCRVAVFPNHTPIFQANFCPNCGLVGVDEVTIHQLTHANPYRAFAH